MSISSDIDVTSCDHNNSIFDDNIDVVAASTADNNSTDDTSHPALDEQVKRTIRRKRRKQLLMERPSAVEFSDVCFYTVLLIDTICLSIILHTVLSSSFPSRKLYVALCLKVLWLKHLLLSPLLCYLCLPFITLYSVTHSLLFSTVRITFNFSYSLNFRNVGNYST